VIFRVERSDAAAAVSSDVRPEKVRQVIQPTKTLDVQTYAFASEVKMLRSVLATTDKLVTAHVVGENWPAQGFGL
jgi:hypothetical protein